MRRFLCWWMTGHEPIEPPDPLSEDWRELALLWLEHVRLFGGTVGPSVLSRLAACRCGKVRR
jgi:hypothetical protein